MEIYFKVGVLTGVLLFISEMYCSLIYLTGGGKAFSLSGLLCRVEVCLHG